ncbi:protein YIPF1 [Schistocerca nitens]|uniref:protein YIPF1 n=1 Tax=Schistocerca nitens TaxID=7011 RepID=UPI0021194C4E|nr:protein YIPF1 [Schistocerca nitens]
MDPSKQSLLDIDIDSRLPDAQLQFQEFPAVVPEGAAELTVSQTMTFNHSPDTPGSDVEGTVDSHLLSESESGAGQKPRPSFWTFEFYQQLWDVDTNNVVDRILWSIIPRPSINYLQHHIKPKPDLYGPFWICVTLVFATAISGNLFDYLHSRGVGKWRYDFHMVTYAATAVFGYAWAAPAALWALARWRGSSGGVSFLELTCVYGYSLAVFVPLSLGLVGAAAWPWLRWSLALIGAALSSRALLSAAWPASAGTRPRALLPALAVGLHALLAVVFVLCFFHGSPTPYTSVSSNISPPIDSVSKSTEVPKQETAAHSG